VEAGRGRRTCWPPREGSSSIHRILQSCLIPRSSRRGSLSTKKGTSIEIMGVMCPATQPRTVTSVLLQTNEILDQNGKR